MAELDPARRDFVADDRREPALGAERADGRPVVGDGVVVGGGGDLDPRGRERTHAILEQGRRVGRGKGVDVQVGGDPSARVDDAFERRLDRRGAALVDVDRLLARRVLEAAREDHAIRPGGDRDVALAEGDDRLQRGAVVGLVAPVRVGRRGHPADDEASGKGGRPALRHVPVQASGPRGGEAGGLVARSPGAGRVPGRGGADPEAALRHQRVARGCAEQESLERPRGGRDSRRRARVQRIRRARRDLGHRPLGSDRGQLQRDEGDALRALERSHGVAERAVGMRQPERSRP